MIRTVVSVFALAGALAIPLTGTASAESWCEKLAKQPAYSYKYQGATVHVPSGKRILENDDIPRRACKVLVKEYRRHTR